MCRDRQPGEPYGWAFIHGYDRPNEIIFVHKFFHDNFKIQNFSIKFEHTRENHNIGKLIFGVPCKSDSVLLSIYTHVYHLT